MVQHKKQIVKTKNVAKCYFNKNKKKLQWCCEECNDEANFFAADTNQCHKLELRSEPSCKKPQTGKGDNDEGLNTPEGQIMEIEAALDQ